jgi:uncharacterized protein YecA (UPF0149 family)
MSLYNQWYEITKKEMTPQQSKVFWEDYFLKEKSIYEKILENKEFLIETTLSDFAKKFELENIFVIGFIDGINTSLNQEIDIQSLTEDSQIKLDINVERLYYNMHAAQAEWLYNLSQWEDILTTEKREQISKEYKASKTFFSESKIGRNDPCICGSGKKYKKCCG